MAYSKNNIFKEISIQNSNKEKYLSPFAMTSEKSKGRKIEENSTNLRSLFQIDRDRIIHTNTFRRLKHKSQVFIAPQGDHYVTRLTHTIEVSQIARTIARALNLNEDLVEATSLGHDLGHSPFGHIGETVLNELNSEGFHHSRQSVRIVEILEKNGLGLNLTFEVIDGIKHHSKPQGDFMKPELVSNLSLEAQIVRLSDSIAYLAHDINDAIRAQMITEKDLPEETKKNLGEKHSERLNNIITDVIISSWDCSGQSKSNNSEKPWIRMSSKITNVITDLRNFMFENIYLPIGVTREGKISKEIVKILFEHYRNNIDMIPDYIKSISNSEERMVTDYVCGMTDLFALRAAEQLKPGLTTNMFDGRF